MNINDRLLRLEANVPPAQNDDAPDYDALLAKVRQELEAGHIEERPVLTGHGRPAYSLLAYKYEYAIHDYRYVIDDALYQVMPLIIETAAAIDWHTSGYAADYRGPRYDHRPQTLDELRAWLDALGV